MTSEVAKGYLLALSNSLNERRTILANLIRLFIPARCVLSRARCPLSRHSSRPAFDTFGLLLSMQTGDGWRCLTLDRRIAGMPSSIAAGEVIVYDLFGGFETLSAITSLALRN